MKNMAPKTESALLRWWPIGVSTLTFVFTVGVGIGGYNSIAKAVEAIPHIQTDVASIRGTLDAWDRRITRLENQQDGKK